MGPRLRATILTLSTAAVLCGCAHDGPARPGGDPEPTGEAPYAGRSKVAAGRCERAGLIGSLRGFLTAINRRDRVGAIGHLAPLPASGPAGRLLGFTVRDRDHPGAGSRSATFRGSSRIDVYRYLTDYVRAGQRFRIAGIGATGRPGPLSGDLRLPARLRAGLRPSAGIAFELRIGSRYAGAKAGVACRTGRFYVWPMGVSDTPPSVAGGRGESGPPGDRRVGRRGISVRLPAGWREVPPPQDPESPRGPLLPDPVLAIATGPGFSGWGRADPPRCGSGSPRIPIGLPAAAAVLEVSESFHGPELGLEGGRAVLAATPRRPRRFDFGDGVWVSSPCLGSTHLFRDFRQHRRIIGAQAWMDRDAVGRRTRRRLLRILDSLRVAVPARIGGAGDG